MSSEQYYDNLIVQKIYAGRQYYQVNGLDYSPEGYILEESPQESKCWLLDTKKVYSHTALRECLIAGILCNDSHLQENKVGQWIVNGNPIEGALIAAASKAKLNQSSLQQLMPKLATLVSASKCRYMATLHPNVDGKIIYIKGAPEIILPRAQHMVNDSGKLVELDSERVVIEAESMSKQGLQVLAFAKKQVSTEKTSLKHADLEGRLVFLGLQGMA